MTVPLARFRDEARGEPYRLVLDDGRVVEVANPGIDALAISGVSTLDTVRLLAGKQATALLKALGPEDYAVTYAVCADIVEHFGAGQIGRLIWLCERYGEAIERDLSYFHGVDLLDLWRGTLSPRKVLAYVDCLPSWSAFVEASAQDDEMAEMFADDDEQGTYSPPIREWTPERAELVKIHEAIRGLTAMVLSALGGKGEQPQPEPRPLTAVDRLAARVNEASYDYLLERIEEARAQ